MTKTLGGIGLPTDPDTRTRITAVAVLVSLVAGLMALALVPAAHADTTNISIKNLSFNPQAVTIPVGSTVHWSNDETDGTTHSVTSDDGLFSQDLNPGDTFSFTFSKAGTFGFHCRFHTYMTGTVTVTDGSSSTTAAPSTTTTVPQSTTSTTAPDSTTTTAPEATTSTTTPGSTTSTTVAEATTTTTAPGSTTSTTAPGSTTSTTAPSSSGSTTSTTTPQDQSIIGGTVIPPVDNALSGVFDALHSALLSLDDALAGSS